MLNEHTGRSYRDGPSFRRHFFSPFFFSPTQRRSKGNVKNKKVPVTAKAGDGEFQKSEMRPLRRGNANAAVGSGLTIAWLIQDAPRNRFPPSTLRPMAIFFIRSFFFPFSHFILSRIVAGLWSSQTAIIDARTFLFLSLSFSSPLFSSFSYTQLTTSAYIRSRFFPFFFLPFF